MKQHITPNQAKEITEDQFYSLFNEIVKRNDWADYHYKKITIGKMIEILDKDYVLEMTTSEIKVWLKGDIRTIRRYEGGLCDTLWKAVKWIL